MVLPKLVTDHDQVPIYLKPGYGFASAMMKWVHGKLIKKIFFHFFANFEPIWQMNTHNRTRYLETVTKKNRYVPTRIFAAACNYFLYLD